MGGKYRTGTLLFNKDRKNGSISAETAADQPDIEGGEE